jgi:hypothetical protein
MSGLFATILMLMCDTFDVNLANDQIEGRHQCSALPGCLIRNPVTQKTGIMIRRNDMSSMHHGLIVANKTQTSVYCS